MLCTGFWDPALFAAAAAAVLAGGLLGWEALTAQARRARPSVPASWCLAPGEPASLLPDGFSVLQEYQQAAARSKRRLLVRRQLSASVFTAVFCCPLGGVGCTELEG